MIRRDKYLNQLINAKENGFPKVVTGIRRCGKSFLLKELYREHLLSEVIEEHQIIIMDLDDDKNIKYRDPIELGSYIRERCNGHSMHYVFLDEIQKVYTLVNSDLTEGKHVPAGKNGLRYSIIC